MAEDLLEIFEDHSFHPTDPPHGLRNFDLGTLSKDQQRLLNKVKMTQRIENEIYLKAHPEVRGLISILLRHLLVKKPVNDVHETVGSFFMRPRGKLIIDLLDYFTETGDSSYIVENLRKEMTKKASKSSDSEMSTYSTPTSSSKSTVCGETSNDKSTNCNIISASPNNQTTVDKTDERL